jgi:hypothetical protein
MKILKIILTIFATILALGFISYFNTINPWEVFMPSMVHQIRITDKNGKALSKACLKIYNNKMRIINSDTAFSEISDNGYTSDSNGIIILYQKSNITTYGKTWKPFWTREIDTKSSEIYWCKIELPNYKPFLLQYGALTNKCFQDTTNYTSTEADSLANIIGHKAKKIKVILKRNSHITSHSS